MASPQEPEQRQLCRRFSEGRWCFKTKQCPFVHDLSIRKAALMEKKLAKLNSSGDSSPMTGVPKPNDKEFAMPQVKNNNSDNSQNGSLVQTQDNEIVQMPSATEGKRQQRVTDLKPPNLTTFSYGKRGKNVLKNVSHASTAHDADDIPKAAQNMDTPKPNSSLSNRSYGQHSDRQMTKSKFLYSLPLHQKVNHSKPRNMATLSVNAQWSNSMWPKVSGYKGKHVETPGPTFARDDREQGPRNGLPRQVGPNSNASPLYHGRTGRQLLQYSVTGSKPLTVFTLFRELPLELRLAIWEIAIRFPYNPTVRLQPVFDDKGAIIWHDVICRSLTPITLRINRESRAEALNHYRLSLDNSTYLNASTNTVFLESRIVGELTNFVASVPQQEIQTIQNLAIKLSEWSHMGSSFPEAVWQFTNLKRLVLMFSISDDEFYLTAGTWKLIKKELKQPEESRSNWNSPMFLLVSSDKVEQYLETNTYV